jgi:cytochrome c
MPYDNPRTLKTDEYYAITAYVLFVNGIVKQDDRLDAKTLPEVKMPNRDGFFPDPRVTGKHPKY